MSGRDAISFSASPGAERSAVRSLASPLKPAGFTGGTTSTRVSVETSWLPTLPSALRRSASLRPIMPAPPMIKTCMRYSLFQRRELASASGADQSFDQQRHDDDGADGRTLPERRDA